MHFYEVRGLLIRRWVPARRRRTMEVWDGDVWVPYLDTDTVLRHGRRVSEAQAIVILHLTRDRVGAVRFSEEDADTALRNRLRHG